MNNSKLVKILGLVATVGGVAIVIRHEEWQI